MATVLRIRLPKVLLSCSGGEGEGEKGEPKPTRGVRRLRDDDSSELAAACARTTGAARRARAAAARDQRRGQSTLAPFLFPLAEQPVPQPVVVETTPVAAPAEKRARQGGRRGGRGGRGAGSAPGRRAVAAVGTLTSRSCGSSALGGRDENQDTFFELTEGADGSPLPCRAWGVLDGHGAHGATASRVAAECICEHLGAAFASRHPGSFTTRAVKTLLKDAFGAAHSKLVELASVQPEDVAECGTTATVAVLLPSAKLLVCWVGDSMAIVLRPPSESARQQRPCRATRSRKVYPEILYRLQEHTLFVERECERVVREGGVITELSPTTRKLLPPGVPLETIKKRRLAINMSRALGHVVLSRCGLTPEPEFSPLVPVQAGDRVLLASDGLFRGQETMDIASAACDDVRPEAAAPRLVERSLAWDRENAVQSDNTTCVCVHLGAVP